MSGVEIIKKKKVLLVLRPIALGVLLTFGGSLWANPVGPQVAAGAATFNSAGKTLTITNTPGTILNWQSFSIGAGELTRFQQQSALSAVLNRVTGANPSSILGTLSSNGRVFLVNPHGIVFGAGSTINTAGFVASTLNISDADFLAGRLKFDGGGNGVLRNEGAIRASGDIFLVGPQIENAGLIRSDNGSVVLAAGQSLTITSPDAQGVQFALQAPADAVLNLGAIEAKNAAAMFAGTLKHSGDIRATSASVDANGRVILAAQEDAIVDGNATINVDNSAGHGGSVRITGERVGLFDNATVSARGEAGGGEILVGGDYQGANPAVRNAARTFVGSDAKLEASATASGDGGKVIVWADDVTRYFGSATVRGGAQGGNGGLVEVSGKNALIFDGRVGLEAANGRAGTLLLDPFNITLQAGAGTLDGFLSVPGDPLLAFGEPDNVTSGTLNVASLQAFTTGTVELQANNDINVNAAVTMQSGVSLKLAAINNVNVNAGITTSGGGNLRLEADTDASGAGVVNLGSVTINAPLIVGDLGKEFSGKVNITGNVTFGESAEAFGKLTYAAGGLSVASGKTLTLKGGMDWATTSAIGGPGAITLPTGQTLALTVAGDHQLSNVTVNNSGLMTTAIGGGQVLLNNSAVVNNAGVFRLADVISVNSGTGTFNNTGTLEVNGSGSATVNGVTFNNTGGALASGTGTLNISSGGNHSGALTLTDTNVRLTGGTHSFADGTTIAGQLNVAGGTASFGTVSANGLLNYTGGGFNVTAGDTLTLNAGMNWATTSAISGPGAITLPAGQTLALTVTGDHQLSNITVNNNGTVTTAIGGGQVLLNNSAVVNNAGVFRLGDVISVNSGVGTFNNTGTLEVNGAATATVNGATFNNTDSTLNSGTGTLNINTVSNQSGALTITGTNVRLTGGTHSFADGTTIAGQLNVVGGTTSFGTAAANGLVNYTGGGLNVTAGDTLTLNAGMNWATTSAISGPGAITLPLGQTLALTVGGDHQLSNVTVNNSGLMTTAIGGGQVLLNDGTVINNAGVFRFLNGDVISRNSGAGTFNNIGEIELGSAVTATVNSVTLTNTAGTLDSGAGTLNISSGGSYSGALTITGANVRLNAGTHSFADGTTIAGQLNVAGGTASFGTVAANGLVNYTGGGFNVTTGDTLTLNNGMNWATTIAISGPGAITLPTGQTLALSVSGDHQLSNVTVNNSGLMTTAIGGGQVLLNNDTVINNAGVFTLNDIISRNSGAGTFNNTGTLQAIGSGNGTVNSVTFNNSGGTLASGTGILSLGAGGNHSGALTITGTNVRLTGGTHSFADGTTIAGQLNVAGGTASFGTVAANGLMNYTGGGFNVTTGDSLTLNAGMNWATTSAISGPGAITLPTGQTLALSVAGDHLLSSVTVNNNGTVTTAIGGSQLLLNDSAAFNNGGVFRFLSGDVISRNSGAGTFNNIGEIELGGAFTATVNSVTFTNTAGTLDSGAGILNLNGGFYAGAMILQGGNVRLTGGTHSFADGTTIAGQLNVAGGTASFGTVSANGLVNYTGGGLNVTAGDTLTLNAGMNWATTSALSGPGAITLPTGQTLALTVAGDHQLSNITVNNDGTVTTAIGGGQVLLNNSTVINNAGVFTLNDIISRNTGAGTFNNTGTLQAVGSGNGTVNSVTFNNTGGTLASGTGILSLGAGGNHSGALTLTGTNVRLTGGTHSFADGTTIAGQLNVTGGMASFGTVAANGLVNYTGGSFNVTAGDTLTLNAGMNWATTIAISGPGAITLPLGQTLALTVAGDHQLSNITVNNDGAVTTAIGGGQVLLNDGTIINNAGVFRLGDIISVNSGTGTFNNTGTLEVSGAGIATVNGVALNNTGGTLASGIGTLNINTGGAQSGTTTISGGNVNFNAGTHAAGGTITAGAGSSFKVGGATFNLGDGSALALADNLNFTSGAINLTGAGAGTTINAGSTLTLSGQSFGGSGKLTNQGTFNAATTTLGGVLVNEGTFNVSSGSATVSGGMTSLSGTTTVGLGRTLDVAGTGLDWQGGTLTGTGTYNLTGGLTLSGNGARVLNGPTFAINNLALPGGSLTVQSGTLGLTGAASTAAGSTLAVTGGTLTSTGTLANAGTFIKSSAGTTTLASAFINAGTVNADAGVLDFAGGYTQSAGQVLLGGGSIAGNMTINGGVMGGSGTLTGNVVNNGGVFNIGSSPGTLTVAGDLTLGAGSTLNVELGGTNQGLDYDLLQVTGTAALDGTLNVALFGGFVGAAGNVFDVLTYVSRSGDFATINFPAGYTMTATPNAALYQLAMSAVPGGGGGGGGGGAPVIDTEVKLPATEVKILNDKFITAALDPGKPAEEEEKKGTVLECK